MLGKLYIVSTPIGNLLDISKRAINILSEVDFVFCEDTRVTKKLFNKYNIVNKLKVFNNINEHYKTNDVINILNDGKDVAIVSDAGTPCISDPGYRVVNAARKNNYDVITIPGPCSVIAALSISGLPTDNFFYQGFLPKKKGRQTKFNELSKIDCSVIIFESPKRVHKTLIDIHKYMGNRVVSLCRELTKMYEEVIVDKVSHFLDKKELLKLKGEYVIIVAKEDYKN